MKEQIRQRLLFLKTIGFNYVCDSDIYLKNKANFNNLASLNLQIKSCALCNLKNISTNIKIGTGSTQNPIIIVSFLPNNNNFNDIIEILSKKYANFYLTSVIKCNASTANMEHTAQCKPYLLDEIDMLKPKFIITLGARCLKSLISNINFDDVRGNFLKYKNFSIMPIYSFEKISKNPSLKQVFLSDLDRLKERL
ncbi:hypothetical protein LMG7974_00272 [Campylobacter majalis]|uniref:Uracil-DNA glycosylase-like domain-containing protein n=1 Tax=Campylobacter majalis TaxID=2790656 RepID=A0ABN7K4N2_9BACT|nr:uracil-DNA glycosylase family protein [Campylobacter majalis]CAD7287390.1 hypothetical protein LMG7974_00272 [Campylobacter majalis]